MYCPKCSQQQISEEMRFCSRCGFPLEGVKELIVAGGVLEKPDNKALSHKVFCNVRQSVALMTGAIPLFIVVGILSAINDGFAVFAVLPILCFVFGFVRLVHTTAKEVKRRKVETKTSLGETPQNAQLPPQRVAPIETFTGHRIETAEMVRPPSVTENTTRLLDEEPASQR